MYLCNNITKIWETFSKIITILKKRRKKKAFNNYHKIILHSFHKINDSVLVNHEDGDGDDYIQEWHNNFTLN